MTTRERPVHYSCLVADAPKFGQQALTWAWTLMDLAGVPAACLHVSALPGADASVLRQLEALGISIRPCEPFRPGHPHCNKISQLDDPALAGADIVALCDTDLAFAASIEDARSPHAIRAKVTDLPNPPIDTWRRIFGAAGLKEPAATSTSFGGHPTPVVNCNGGLYLVPGALLAPLRSAWTTWVDWMIARPGLLEGPQRVHVDQVAFGLAVVDAGLPLDLLPLEDNLPTHAWVGPLPDVVPRVLHYHDNVDASGFLRPVGRGAIDAAIGRVNDVIRARRQRGFENAAFWDFRYANAPDLGSGLGSRGPNLAYKRRLLTDEVLPTDRVLDVGCGDLEVSRALATSHYTGVDVSGEALALAAEKRPDWTFVQGELHDLRVEPHDVVVCFDVLIHQRTDAAYRALVCRLLQSATRTLLVSGYNQEPWHRSEITFFHEPLTTTLGRLAGHAAVAIVGGYRDTTVVRVDVTAAIGAGAPVAALRGDVWFDTPLGRFTSKPDDLISAQLREFGGHTRGDVAMLRSLLAPGDAVVDIGAHLGSFAVPLARQVGPTGLVVAVEPDAVNLERLYQNVVANGCADRIAVVPALVGDDGRRFRPVVDHANTGALHFAADPTGPVVAVSVDSLVARVLPGRRPALLKIDVEGLETTVLRSAGVTLARDRPLVFCEVVEDQLTRQGTDARALGEVLRAAGYTCFRNTGPRNAADDGFVVTRLEDLHAGGSFFDCLAVPDEQVAGFVARGLLPA